MTDFVSIFESPYLFSVEVLKAKLSTQGIESFIKNKHINHVAVLPINQYYILCVDSQNETIAKEILAKELESDTNAEK